MHVLKIKKHELYALFVHNERKEGVTLSNTDIEMSRSYLNYNLAKELQPLKPYDFIKSKLTNVKVRKDSVIACSWVVTKPKCVKDEDEEAFFEAVFAFLNETYGEQNVVSAYVHKDEKTPHLHYIFMPLIKDENKTRLCAKDIINREHLKSIHRIANEYVSEVLGYDVGIVNGVIAKRGVHYGTVDELKKETIIVGNELEELKEIKESINNEIEEILVAKESISQLSEDEITQKLEETIEENTILKKYIKKLEDLLNRILQFLEKNNLMYFLKREISEVMNLESIQDK